VPDKTNPKKRGHQFQIAKDFFFEPLEVVVAVD
jgi:hypothetical protein